MNLLAASEEGNLQAVRHLLQSGADVHEKGFIGMTALHFACVEGHPSVCRELLAYGADPNAQTQDGQTPLHLSIHPDVALPLMEHGANLNAQDHWGQTPLHLFCGNHQTSMVKALVEHGADQHAINDLGQTPLMLASACNHVDAIAFLGQADVNAQDDEGNAALHYASNRGHAEAIVALVERGADATLENHTHHRNPAEVCSNDETFDVLCSAVASYESRLIREALSQRLAQGSQVSEQEIETQSQRVRRKL